MSPQSRLDESPQERVERYRRMADSTRELAARTDDRDIKAAYLELAHKWVSLAKRAADELPSLVEPDLLPELSEEAPRRRRHSDEDGIVA